MNDTRFVWARATESDGAYELKNRQVRKHLLVDNDLRCWIKECRSKFRKGAAVYYPNPSVNTSTNKVIGHVECIDRFCEERKALVVEKKVLPPLAAASLGGAVLTTLLELKQKYYREGFEAGVAAVVAQLTDKDESQSSIRH